MTVPRYKWQPTTAEIAAAAGIEPDDVIRFDHNTTPWPTDWAAAPAAAAGRHLNEYPGASYAGIRRAAAARHGLEVDQIVPGAGIDELILLAGRAFLGPGQSSIAVTPTYPLYRIATAQVGAAYREISAAPPDFPFPLDAVIEAAPDAALVWLCVPNNPTGVDVPASDLEAVVFATAGGIVIIDAAYAEFTAADWAAFVQRHSNVVVLRTLSKAFALAGARVGYAMGHPSLIDALDALRPPGSIASISADLAEAALGRPEIATAITDALVAARQPLAAGLDARGYRVLPSSTNFLLCEVGAAAHRQAEALLQRGLIVRSFPKRTGLEDYLRFTVRSPEQNELLLKALAEVAG